MTQILGAEMSQFSDSMLSKFCKTKPLQLDNSLELNMTDFGLT